MKRNNEKKMTNSLLYVNKKSVIDVDINNGRKYKDNSEIKSISTITGTANNPFAYLLRSDKVKEQETKEISNNGSTVCMTLITHHIFILKVGCINVH